MDLTRKGTMNTEQNTDLNTRILGFVISKMDQSIGGFRKSIWSAFISRR
jgi:hypothetical protein